MHSFRRSVLVFLAGLGFVFWTPIAGVAQESRGQIYGVARDSSGATVPGVSVILTQAATGVKRILVTNDVGHYGATKLTTGPYMVEAELAGFKKFVQTGIRLLPGDHLEVNVTLEIGNVAETVTVNADAPLVNTSSGTNKFSLDTQFLDSIPLKARDAGQLLKIVPSATKMYYGDVYSIAGLDDRKNQLSIDGTTGNDPSRNTIANTAPPPDVLKEFSIETNFSAEYGGTGGAKLLFNTKSGTNQLHGSVYDYFRSENLNANTFQRNALNQPKADFKRHQLGFTVGGPVFLPKLYDGRNRTFFFVGHQQLQTPSSPYLWGRGGLTQAELEGDFSRSLVIPTVTQTGSTVPGSPFAGMVGQQITNLRPFLSPTTTRLYRQLQYPLVQNSGERYFESRTQATRLPEWIVRMDQSIGSKNTLSFNMYYRYNNPELRPFEYGSPLFERVSRFKNQHYGMSDVWIFSPTVVNELRVGYQRSFELTEARNEGVSDFGLAYPAEAMIVWGTGPESTFRPSWFMGRSSPKTYDGSDIYDYIDTLSFTKGAHAFKTGATVQTYNRTTDYGAQPYWYWRGGYLTSEAAEYMIGWPADGSVRGSTYSPERKNIAHFFFQDDWKVNPRLSLNLGVRYEPAQWGYYKNDIGLMFDPAARSRYTNFPQGVYTFGDPAWIGRAGVDNDWDNIAPRVGFAYRLNENGNRVLRGAWGLFYDPLLPVWNGSDLKTTTFPFRHDYFTRFDPRFPANDIWLDTPAYMGIPRPDLSTLPDVSKAVFDPLGVYGGPGGLTPTGNDSTAALNQWNLTYEQEFSPGWLASFTYQGHEGINMTVGGYWNVAEKRDASDSWATENLASRRPIQEYRYREQPYRDRAGGSHYHAGVFKLQTRTMHFRMSSWYALSYMSASHDATINDNRSPSHPGPLQDTDWGRPSHHRTHNLMLLPSWDLPMRGRQDLVGTILGDWTATVVYSARSGTPVDTRAINNSYTCVNCWNRGNLVSGQLTVNENWRDDPNLVYFNPLGIVAPPDGQFGTMKMGELTFTPDQNVDLSLTKAFVMPWEGARIELRMDAFNLFNWVSWRDPRDVNVFQPITYTMKNNWTAPSREIQIGARFVW